MLSITVFSRLVEPSASEETLDLVSATSMVHACQFTIVHLFLSTRCLCTRFFYSSVLFRSNRCPKYLGANWRKRLKTVMCSCITLPGQSCSSVGFSQFPPVAQELLSYLREVLNHWGLWKWLRGTRRAV